MTITVFTTTIIFVVVAFVSFNLFHSIFFLKKNFLLSSYLQLQCHLYTKMHRSACMHLLMKNSLFGDSNQLLIIYKEYSYKL